MKPEIYQVGPSIKIEELSEELAISIFGLPVYLEWKRDFSKSDTLTQSWVVTSVDRKSRIITIGGI